MAETPPLIESRDYSSMSRAALQAHANTRQLGPDGRIGKGASGWRATASKEALTAALEANDTGVLLDAPEAPSLNGSDLSAVLAHAIAAHLPKASVDEATVRAIVSEMLAESGTGSLTIKVTQPSGETVDVGRVHPQFPTLLAFCARRRNVWVVGPAGSGKSHAARQVADALSLPYGSVSVGPQTTQSALFGFIDAAGCYRSTEFRKRFEAGGVFVIDEIDRGNAGVLTCLNQAIENGHCGFPDGMIPRHPDFVLVACANTFGNGASRQYVGALQIDAATLDRFAFLAWDYDASLELDIAIATCEAAGGSSTMARNWVDVVRHHREKCDRLSLRHIISPRASIYGAEMLAAGLTEAQALDAFVFKGLDADAKAKLS